MTAVGWKSVDAISQYSRRPLKDYIRLVNLGYLRCPEAFLIKYAGHPMSY